MTGLFLYGAAVTTVAAGRRRQKLIWRASLWLELAAALALTWWFCDPHWSDRGFWVDVEHAELGRNITYPGAAAIYSGWPDSGSADTRPRPPRIGQPMGRRRSGPG